MKWPGEQLTKKERLLGLTSGWQADVIINNDVILILL